MIQETIKVQLYRGVLCGYCRQPIPLSGIVDRIATGETEPASRKPGTPVFNLRCRACEREKTYCMNEIVEFEGSPRPRSLRMQSTLLGHEPRVARAAHG
jgi:hypothetical protein